MKKSRIITTIAGVLLFLSIVLTFVWFFPMKRTSQPGEIAFADIVTKIEKGEVKAVIIKQSSVDVTDRSNQKYSAALGSEPTREILLDKIKEYNKINTGAAIKYSEESVSSNFEWFVWFNFATFFTMWAATLAVIVYAVRTLSRNKS
jgi:ATP-dependent Zn protease